MSWEYELEKSKRDLITSNKINFRAKQIIRNKTGYNKGSINPPRYSKFSLWATHNRVSKYMKQKLIELKGDLQLQLKNSTPISQLIEQVKNISKP